jgi:hypothetical protein
MSDIESLGAILARMGLAEGIVDRTPMEQEAHVNATRERVWHAACQLGRCRYATADVAHDQPPWVDSTETCGGYHGSRVLHAETGEATWHWRPCVRHLAWWERRKAFRANEKRGMVNSNMTPRAKPKVHEDDDGVPF